jgi:hypothetical protein
MDAALARPVSQLRDTAGGQVATGEASIHMNSMDKNRLDKRAKRMVFFLFLVAAGFYIAFIALTAVSS